MEIETLNTTETQILPGTTNVPDETPHKYQGNPLCDMCYLSEHGPLMCTTAYCKYHNVYNCQEDFEWCEQMWLVHNGLVHNAPSKTCQLCKLCKLCNSPLCIEAYCSSMFCLIHKKFNCPERHRYSIKGAI